jgi:two-component system CheB/CheR fusion protein
VAEDLDPAFEAMLEFLKESRGFDFTGYKRSSLVRRVDRRMAQVGIASYTEYVDYLQVHQEEFPSLFNTILINVTGFFRDADSWTHLAEDVLPEVLASRKPSEPIRVWSAGCASGEEAFTAAILLAEVLGPDEFRERVKIYATDVDEEALAQGRHAAYNEHELRGVPTDLREKYFEIQNQRFVFRADLRRSIIFGRNDLVQDAPISRVDVLLCRNTLMYFNAETQEKILGRFHFALADGGMLFLGKAEMLLSHGHLFTPIDLKRRFFRKVPRKRAVGPGLGGNGGGYELANGSEDLARLRIEALATSPVATLAVTGAGTLASANLRAETLFNLNPRDIGRPFRDLEISYRPLELRSVIDQAVADRRPAWARGVEWARSPTETVFLDIQVVPLGGGDDTDAAVALFFNDVTPYRRLQGDLEYTNRQLETAYEELQSTVEELETTNEELQSTVEELETTNEELQSTNEELETMNEELQSTNDELQTINDELRDRTQELDDTNAFMESILRSLRAAVIVVDKDMIVRVWNERADDLWGLRQEEALGQNLMAVDIGLATEKLKPMLRDIIQGAKEQAEVRLDATNRKGRAINVRVVGSPLQLQPDSTGAILVIDEAQPLQPDRP